MVDGWNNLKSDEKKKKIEEIKALKIELIKLLLEKGANVNHQGKDGRTPFDLALKAKDFETCDLFLDTKGINLFLKNKQDQSVYH
mmetsp:Transcript_41579/g.36959  ORF Transcript_41579/g.36959 Transcript_41579/m.36959 type:complete len:85 (+) Transcript_41579:2561-2815(+)